MEKNEIIKVEQLPVIRERLSGVSEKARERISDALSLVVSEDTVREIKSVRASLNKEFSDLEAQRKAVKTAILAPYNEFEAVYRELITSIYTDADDRLKKQIQAVEGEVIKAREEEVRAYFDELCVRENIDWVRFSDANIKVGLSASIKSLKESCAAYVDSVVQDIRLIRETNPAELAPEILVEYKRVRNPLVAIRTVLDRKKDLEQVVASEEIRTEQREAERARQEQVMEFLPPAKTIPEQSGNGSDAEKVYTSAFRAKGTKDQLKRLAAYMRASGIVFETIRPEQHNQQATNTENERAPQDDVAFVLFEREDETLSAGFVAVSDVQESIREKLKYIKEVL